MERTRDGYTLDEAETYYHEARAETYEPVSGNDSLAFERHIPALDVILGSPISRWTIRGIIARGHADGRRHLNFLD